MTRIIDEEVHFLERAEQHVEVAFRFACYFLNQQGNTSVTGTDLLRLRGLAWQFYNRYSSVMQLSRHHAGLLSTDKEEDNIIPLHPY